MVREGRKARKRRGETMSSLTLQMALKYGKEYARYEMRKGKIVITIFAEMKPREVLPGQPESDHGVYMSEYRKAWDVTIQFSMDLSSGGETKVGKLSLPQEILAELSKLNLVASLSYTYQENPDKSVLRILNLPNNAHSIELLEKVDSAVVGPFAQKYEGST